MIRLLLVAAFLAAFFPASVAASSARAAAAQEASVLRRAGDLRDLARAALRSDDLSAAKQRAQESLELDEGSAEGWLLLGYAEFIDGEERQALLPWRRAVRLEPGRAAGEFRELLRDCAQLDRKGDGRGDRQREAERLLDAIDAFRLAVDQVTAAARGADGGNEGDGAARGADGGNEGDGAARGADAALTHDVVETVYVRRGGLDQLATLETALRHYSSSLLVRGPGAMDRPAALNNRGVALIELGRWSEALAALDRASRDCGTWGTMESVCVQVFVNRGRALAGLGREAEAVTAYELAIQRDPRNFEGLYNLGNALRRLGREDDAIEAYERAADSAPQSAAARYNLANTCASFGRKAEAVAAYRAALLIDPDYAEAHHNLALFLEDDGRPREAISHLRRALAIHPRYIEAHYSLAKILGESSSPPERDEALALLSHVAGFDPDSSRAHVERGVILAGEGENEAAVAAFRHALAIDPDAPYAQLDLGLALKSLGRRDEAAEALAAATRSDPGDAAAWYEWGLLLKGQGILGEARSALEQALRLDETALAAGSERPELGRTLFALGDLYERLGLDAAADSAFARLQQVDPAYADTMGLREPSPAGAAASPLRNSP